jgi:Zn-dependent peptidase ImmA (M78 family)
LNLTFTVLFMDDAQMAGTGAVGYCDPETQTLAVSNSQANDSMQDTFLHEVLHAICHVMGLRETEKEENFVRRLATGLCTVWNNNPKAFKWWSGLV